MTTSPPPSRPRNDGLNASSSSSSHSHHHNTATTKTTDNSNNNNNNNPITTDAELNILVHTKLAPIQKYKTFQRWKGNFLDRFQTLLSEKGMPHAQDAADHMQATFCKLTKQTTRVLQFIQKGDLSNDKKTVKASLAVQEMCNTLEITRSELEALIPSLQAQERRCGYSKFHLGAILIHQDFPQYIAMRAVEGDLAKIQTALSSSLDRQQVDCFHHYHIQVVRFCDILADLDLYEVMKKCILFRNPLDESESEDPEEITLHIVNTTDINNETIQVEVFETDTVAILQEIIVTGFDNMMSAQQQVLSYKGDVVPNDTEKTTLADLGIQDGDTIEVQKYLLPLQINLWDDSMAPKLYKVDPNSYVSDLHRKCAADFEIESENLQFFYNDAPLQAVKKLQEYGLKENDVLILEPKCIRVKCELPDGAASCDLQLSMDDTLPNIQQEIEQASSLPASKQVVSHDGVELKENSEDDDILLQVRHMGLRDGDTLQVHVYKIPEDAVLDLEILDDPIVLVDCKLGTMFALQRDEAIESGAVTCNQGNSFEFVEAVTKAVEIEKGQMTKAMLESPQLGVKPQLVVAKMDVEDYDLQEAAAVKNKWGVALKKTTRDKRGEELLFVDLKTESVGYLDRKKLTDLGVIKAIGVGKDETLKQAETDQQRYDFFVREIRGIFKISSAK